MSESEKRTPISIYLTPKASMVLKEYSQGSGYGSLSRTVEEIILAFDSTYDTLKQAMNWVTSLSKEKKELTATEKASFFVLVIMFLSNINNAMSRLNKEKRLPS